MYASFLGEDGFRKGTDLYFERHDGQAVTCDDFRAAMADANDFDFSRFERWYLQAGTPRLRARDEWDASKKRYTLRFEQDYPETAFEIVGADDRKPLPMPIRLGLLGADGADLPLRLEGEPNQGDAPRTRVLELADAEAEFVFEGLSEKPVPSILRGFSAPVRFEMTRDRAELAFLMAHDSDAFNRWDAGQQLALELLVERAAPGADPEAALDAAFAEAWGRVLSSPELDGSLKALALGLPAERVIAAGNVDHRPGCDSRRARIRRCAAGRPASSDALGVLPGVCGQRSLSARANGDQSAPVAGSRAADARLDG